MYIIHIAGMVLCVGKEFYVIQILELFYVEIIIFPVIFDGQTPLGVLSRYSYSTVYGKSAWKKNENEKEKKREKTFGQVVLQTGNFHCRMGRVCGACGCPILGAVLER